MDHTKQLEILDDLFRMVDNHQNVDAGVLRQNPTSVYVDPDLARTEWDAFFRNYPQMIGLSGELPEPGSFLTVDDFGVPVLATRDREGRFHAFVNACRHRGTRLVQEKRGKARTFACPFHFWGYDNTGRLTSIPEDQHFGSVDKSCLGLVRLPAVEQNNMLWVHPQPDGEIDVTGLLGGLEPELANWAFDGMVFMDETVMDKRLNWKLANDTFGETYHFSRLHKRTLNNIFYGDALHYETFGRNHRFTFPSRRIDQLRDLPRDEWRITQGAIVLYYLFPNIQLILGRGTVNLVKIYPDRTNPSRSISRVAHYFSRRLLEAKQEAANEGQETLGPEDAYNLEKVLTALPDIRATAEVFDSTIEQEDYAMGEGTQRAVESGALPYLIFGRNEPALHHFHAVYRDALGLPPLEEYRG